ncbi:MAG TPA: hypothetical protein VMB72_01695, partial [Acidimicrobiales bacterium]|nr:hypothetical protein [Acidimicrobiales bacterium]
ENEPDLACIVHDGAAVTANLAQAPNLSNLSTALATNQLFFGAVAAISPTGPAKAVTSGDSARDDQEWLRTRLLIPPGQPSAIAYAQPVTLPPILPGAACDTEFGAGAPAVSQAGFHPTGPNAQVEAPTGAQAQVRGGGSGLAATPSAARLPPSRPQDPPVAGVLLGAGFVIVTTVATRGRRRRGARAARPRRVGVPERVRRAP